MAGRSLRVLIRIDITPPNQRSLESILFPRARRDKSMKPTEEGDERYKIRADLPSKSIPVTRLGITWEERSVVVG